MPQVLRGLACLDAPDPLQKAGLTYFPAASHTLQPVQGDCNLG
jgi:hypothetical protein